VKICSWVKDLEGTFKVKDSRIEILSGIFRPPKVTYPQITFVERQECKDTEGIVILEKDKLELIIDDLDIIEKQIFKGNLQTELLEKAKSILEKEKFIYENILPQERIYLKNIGLKSTEPVFIIKEEKLQNRDELLKEIFSFFGYIIFFTCNQKELRAWSIKKGTTAVEAAAKIHTDIARGFIKAEVISFDVLSKYKRISEIKQRNLVRYEDKDYVVNDADFITFKFNV